MTQSLWSRASRAGLPAILALYAVLAGLYAAYTPAWQAPDEPAHYNYVRYLATAQPGLFPVLKLGDYPAAYLEQIKAERFPPGMSIDPIRYEFHQPPLYYLLAVPVYRLFAGWLYPLRLLSVVLGGALLLVVGWAVQELAPRRPGLALGTVAFVAFLPMHLAFTAAVNNDTLAELLLAVVLLIIIRYLKAADAPSPSDDIRLLVLLGITTGLGFLTKTSDYIAPVLVLAAIAVRHVALEHPAPPARDTAKSALLYLLPAVCLGLPWWLRNMAVYGAGDFLGLGRHAQVVAGQLRTAEFLAAHGPAQLARDFLLTSFHSFWGQFGWMGVLIDGRLYQAVGILSAVAVFGFLVWAARTWKERGQTGTAPWQWAGGGLLALSVALTAGSYLWYNTQYVQHQGRYLFPALLPIGLAFALGWREALRRDLVLPLALLLAVPATVARAAGWWSNGPWLLWCAAAAAVVVRGALPRRFDSAVQAVPYLLLIPLDLACLFLFIVPQLAL